VESENKHSTLLSVYIKLATVSAWWHPIFVLMVTIRWKRSTIFNPRKYD